VTARVVEIVHVRGCPNLDAVLALVRSCLTSFGPDVDVVVHEGEFASPTVLVDGRDVLTGRPPISMPSCRLDVPTASQILAALERTAT